VIIFVFRIPGIIRNDACVWHSSWQGYECHDLDYEMLIIESMDADSETRRVSPVAILGDRYLDLINGPQDHGYTCRKRISTFMAVVATGKRSNIYVYVTVMLIGYYTCMKRISTFMAVGTTGKRSNILICVTVSLIGYYTCRKRISTFMAVVAS
jgi:hypothetical protein